ncbi:MAG: dihydropteroate synthase [Thermodesulfobacteriota bacterium]
MPFAVDPARTLVMGILNVTPDSFSDGGAFLDPGQALAQAEAMLAAGADLLDVGGESTRPFAAPVAADQELARVLPVIEAIRARWPIPLSVDTRKAMVAEAALAAGADLVNDVSALTHDPAMVEVVRRWQVPVVLMHMQGRPETMQLAPAYGDVVAEVKAFLAERIAWAQAQGIPRQHLIVDPGIGFGKTVEHNLALLRGLPQLRELGCPVLVGHSRKAFLGKVLGIERPADRDLATAAVSALCAAAGVAVVRVHDVAATAQAVRIARAITGAHPQP